MIPMLAFTTLFAAAVLFFLVPVQMIAIAGLAVAALGVWLLLQPTDAAVLFIVGWYGYALIGSGFSLIATAGALHLILGHLSAAPERTAREIVSELESPEPRDAN